MPSIRKVLLLRRNVLANYASAKAAWKANVWGRTVGKEIPPAPTMRFNEKDFLKHWNDYMSFYGWVMRDIIDSRSEYFLLHYEDINDQYVMSGLLNFIGADASKPLVPDAQIKQQVKLHSNDIVARFENEAGLRRYLEKNELLHWAHEGERSFRMPQDNSATDRT
jgi:hypothetical protein